MVIELHQYSPRLRGFLDFRRRLLRVAKVSDSSAVALEQRRKDNLVEQTENEDDLPTYRYRSIEGMDDESKADFHGKEDKAELGCCGDEAQRA